MSEDRKCYFCGYDSKVTCLPEKSCSNLYECEYCGTYILDRQGFDILKKDENKFKMACVLNERRLKGFGGIALDDETKKEEFVYDYPRISVNELLDDFPQKASDFLNRTLLNLSRLSGDRPFKLIKLDIPIKGGCLPLFISNSKECYAFLNQLAEQGFIRAFNVKAGLDFNVFSLTIKFWEMVENIKKTEVGNKRVFVAMWFHESMNDYYKDGIKKAIEEAGYEPVRIDLQEFNEKICDEIIAEIKRCKFLVSDFSGQRGGVYFEAGFAKGLGKEVIFTVKKDDVKKLHFDTRQYNHIVYDSPEDLYKQLYNRICATIV